MKRPFISLFYKFIVIMILISAVPLTFQGLKMISINSPVYKTTIKEDVHARISTLLATYIEEFVVGLNLKMDFAVAMELFPDISWEGKTIFLLSTLKSNDNFIVVSMLDKKGMETTKVTKTDFSNESNINVSRKKVPAFIQTLKTGKPCIGPVYYQGKYPRFNIVYPLTKTKEYIFITVTLSSLWKRMESISVGETGFVYVVNSEGKIIYHKDIKRALKFEDVSETEIVNRFVFGEDQGSMEFIDYSGVDNVDGTKMVGAFAKVKSLKWGIIVQQKEEEAYATIESMRKNAIFWIVFTVFISVLVAIFLGGSMTRPIRKLTNVAEKLGKGDLSQHVEIKTHDELRTLGTTINFMADKIRNSQEELVAREKMVALGQMASVVGHEIRNPLGVISNAIYFIKTRIGESDPKIDKHIRIIEREVAASNKIVTDLLGYSRTREVKLVKADVNEVLKESIEVVSIPEHVQLQENITDRLFAVIDPDEAREMFVNIIDNACQAMPDGGTISISSRKIVIPKYDKKEAEKNKQYLLKFKEGDKIVKVTVADTGVGISKENIDKLFVPFFTTRQKGTGLGLAVVERIIDRLKGAIKVETGTGKGAKFIMFLPMA